MRGFIKYIAFLVLFLSCGRDGSILDTGELHVDFEDIWWEPVGSSHLNRVEGKVCLDFNTYLSVEPPADGVVIQYIEGDDVSYVFSDFQRIDGGYYLLKYDAEVFVFQDDDGYYIEIKYLGFTDKVDIIPCSLGQ